ncbi:MAG: protein translocase subunit SecD [Chlamydiota bacterium]
MERKNRWQSIVITIVILLTIYNILPTVLYYSKPLNSPIDKKQATPIARAAAERVNQLEPNALSWLQSFNQLLGIKASSMTVRPNSPDLIDLQFTNPKDAATFAQHLPRAGSLIPFIPAQLSLAPDQRAQDEGRITVQRNIPLRFDLNAFERYFQFSHKRAADGKITPLYRDIIADRLLKLGLAVGGTSDQAALVQLILNQGNHARSEEFLLLLADDITTYTRLFGESSLLAKRYFATLTQSNDENKSATVSQLRATFERYLDQIKLKRIDLQKREEALQLEGKFLESAEKQDLDFLLGREKKLTTAIAVLKRQATAFSAGARPWTYPILKQDIGLMLDEQSSAPSTQTLSIGDKNPLIDALILDWGSDTISVVLKQDILDFKEDLEHNSTKPFLNDQLDQLIYNEMARIGRETNETLTPKGNGFQIALNALTNSQSFLALNLSAIASEQATQVLNLIKNEWRPSHADLEREAFPIYDYQTFQNLPAREQKLGLVVYAPGQFDKIPPKGFRSSSIYVIAKGLEDILNKVSSSAQSTQMLQKDFESLNQLLQQSGFVGYPGTSYLLGPASANDYLFEAEDFYQTILKATRENFAVHGTHRYATLEFTDLKQRILTLNRIETSEHENLLTWKDEYHAAQVSLNAANKYDIPAPTKNALLSNLALSARKYFRGDERKILHWGLDLSGGKTVQIELRDTDNRIVTDEASLKQGIDELYNRVNKMGVSEVTIRQEGSHITLDFPSAQGLSAAELVKASSMQFHIVNEKFGPRNSALRGSVDQFLQAVWNEAVITGRKDLNSINHIAWKHLYGTATDLEAAQPTSEAAKTLLDSGLRLSLPGETKVSSSFNDLISKIAILRGDSYTDWGGQTHPLVIVMNNYALEGSNLTNVHASYDPTQGNYLSFEVKGSQTLQDGQKINPRSEFYNWTSTFSKENIQGTSLASFSRNEGWRMAVVLNGLVISSPSLQSALRDRASITGSFTQREANRLEADLKAGSLSFTPRILSEQNVSPELGMKDRYMGILATVIALALVFALMIGYYRFSGLIASIAVLFNLLIIWATLQNLQATVTLAGIAGIILTVGMAVDANVLVFERIREEFAVSGRIASAVHAGYRKAFSAILDSNLTTIIAALILLNFDSGPIKGFAVTLIIGIASSMFTALFMTRSFFAKWVQNPQHKMLKMASWIKKTQIDFLKYSRVSLAAVVVTVCIGAFFLVKKDRSILGMDFTGGYSLEAELKSTPAENYRHQVETALLASGLKAQEFQVRELSPNNQVKILLSHNLDQLGRPFYGLSLEEPADNATYPYQNNPRIVWVIEALHNHGVELTLPTLQNVETSWTNISGQMSSAMRKNAIIGLSLALLCILIYITIRFEFKYAMSATLGLAIDVTVTLSLVSILHALGVPIQIDLNTIAALMTIIGYSLNDTIIIFDRIREDLKHSSKMSFRQIINVALNSTLSRTLMTSMTTLVVLIALLILGGYAIFGLSLVMVIGVIFGTFSSLFVAAPLLLFFHKKESTKTAKNLALNGT